MTGTLPGHAAPQPGDTIAHYRLLERLGRDKDTTIFRARDLTLDRDVAVKLLAPEHAASATAHERFRREAHIASLVSHPHICAVHDSGEEDGQAFIVCELLEGRALDELLRAGPLPPDRLLDLAIQLADGLNAIHRRGLVHGNIKPSNVFITDDGHVKLLELGLMSAWSESASRPEGVDSSSPTASATHVVPVEADVEGFHSYRSPEHLAGEPLDHRSDIFSVGAVMYEMATGEQAFPGDTPSRIAAAIVSSRPVTAGARNPAMTTIEPVVHKALEKDPEQRYQNAADLLADLRRARRRVESSGSSPIAMAQRRRHTRPAIALLLLTLLAGAGWWWQARSRGPGQQRQRILVGGIANGTNDPDFDGTLRQALTVHLGQSPFLDIVSEERVRQILQMMGRPPGTALTHAIAREACQRLQASAVIEGGVTAVGRTTIVTLGASDCHTGETIMRDQADVERKEDVLQAVGRIASSMRQSLGESVRSVEGYNVPIQEATTPSLEALKAFTAGIEKRAAGAELESIPFFERAVELDPAFALAYTTLSTIYGGLGETRRSEEYARLAYEHSKTVSERERLYIVYQYHDRVTGDQLETRAALELWKRAYPLDYRPANALALLLNRLGDYERAITEAEDAVRLNPAHAFPYSNLAYAFRGAGRYDQARKTAERAIALGIETLPTRRLLYQLAELERDQAAAERHLAWARGRPRGFDLIGAQAQVAAFRGEMFQARRLFEQTIEEAVSGRLTQIAAGYGAQLALTDALYGYPALAAARAQRIRTETSYEPQLRAATALALGGSPDEAESWIARIRGLRPSDTLLQSAYIPVADAATQLAHDRPDAALQALRPAAPYERGTVAALLPIYFRGEARRRTSAFGDAAREFRAVVASRGADPFSAAIPLAYLGLARSLAASGDTEGSRRAYNDLLEVWKNADPDLPALTQARAEAAALGQ